MKKILLYTWMCLWLTMGHVTGQGTLDPNFVVDIDNLTSIECTTRSITRKSQVQNRHGTHLELNDSLSLNWCGPASITGSSDHPNPSYGSVKAVSGSWTVPAVTGLTGNIRSTSNTYSAIWVGIDGYNNATVEQIGTEQDLINGNQDNYAWFDLYPADTQLIEGFPVNVGDVIEGSVRYLGVEDESDIFCLTIKNLTQGKKFSINQRTQTGIPAHRSSAEWIVEAPGIILPSGQLAILPLANFSSVSFHKCKAEINDHEGSINDKHWTFDAINMISSTGEPKATISHLGSKGKSFTVTWNSSGPFPNDPVAR